MSYKISIGHSFSSDCGMEFHRIFSVAIGKLGKWKCKQKLFSCQIFQSQISKPMKFAGKKWALSRNIQTSEIILNYGTTLDIQDQETRFINFERL